MERLTYRDKDGFPMMKKRGGFKQGGVERLAAYEDTGLTPEEINDLASVREISPEAEYAINKHADNIIERLDKLLHQTDDDARLRELAEADKDGRVVVLPCKVGDTVWVTRNPWTGKLLKKPLDAYVNGMKMYSHGLYVNLLFDTRKINGTRDYEINHIGKTVFLTGILSSTHCFQALDWSGCPYPRAFPMFARRLSSPSSDSCLPSSLWMRRNQETVAGLRLSLVPEHKPKHRPKWEG